MFVITPISRAASPASVSTITSNDSYSTTEESSDLPLDFDPIVCYNILTTLRTNMDNSPKQNFLVPSMNKLIQFNEELDNASKLSEQSVLNQSPINISDVKIKSSHEHVNNMNFINQENSSAIQSTINLNTSSASSHSNISENVSDNVNCNILSDDKKEEDEEGMNSALFDIVSKNTMQSPKVESNIYQDIVLDENTKDNEDRKGEMDMKVEFVSW
jgi:hypothetical protein